MQIFSRWPESQARLVRWVLLIGWLLIILSLLLPLSMPENLVPECSAGNLHCLLHHQPGNRLFWGVVVPSGVLIIVLLSHELWRRICPLAFVSQLFRALGRQRTQLGKGGKPEVVKVATDSWLGRHHVQLQWSLLIAGLCLRLLVVNSNPLGLALFLLVTLAAAIAVGWAYGGKAWCQYLCPMAPVQTVLTGPRGPLGSPAHLGTNSKVTQSMCRSLGDSGKEQSACVACQAPCLDIDAERAFWQNLSGKRGLDWAWYSYPGLVWAFFELMQRMDGGASAQNGDLIYLRSGLWAYDAGLPGRALDRLFPFLPLPSLVVVPLALVLAAWLSVALFRALAKLQQRRYLQEGRREAASLATFHTRLIATFMAINCFFWFVDPSQGAFGPHGGQLIRSLVLTVSAIWLFRSWGRDQATYRRESTSESLRRQLKDLPELAAALDGRSLAELSPQEVFTLAKALPAVGLQRSREIYRGVVADMLRTGRLERAAALLQLQDLRQTLQLEDQDHHEAMRWLAQEQPNLLRLDARERQVDDLRREAVAEAIHDLLATAGMDVLDPSNLRPALAERLEQLRASCGLNGEGWAEMLESFGPKGNLEQQRLNQLLLDWQTQAALLTLLQQEVSRDAMLRPLLLAMELRVGGLAQLLDPRLAAAALPPLPQQMAAAGSLEQAFDLLWEDPDPDTAGWVLMLERQRHPERLARRLQHPRQGLASSPFLEIQRRGEPHPDTAEFPFLAASPLFADLPPAGLVWVASQGEIHEWQPGEVVVEEGAISDGLGVVLAGSGQVSLPAGTLVILGPGETIGEMGVITGSPRNNTVKAGPEGLRAFQVPRESFEELLHRSRYFSRGLLRQLAERLTASSR